MKTPVPLTYKIADQDWIFEAIHRLNYQTFVEEIPQHEDNPLRRLVDKFDHENTYIVCLRGRRLLGMVALRAMRPFSLDQKLADLDSYLPHARSVCELRLLAVDPDARTGIVCYGLMNTLRDHCRRHGHDLAVISATVRQLKLYNHLGFHAFGPLVGSDGARFQPMYITLEAAETRLPSRSQSIGKIKLIRERGLDPARDQRGCSPPVETPFNCARLKRRGSLRIKGESGVSFLPGPVAISDSVRRRFSEPPRSHRCESFVADFKATQQRLCTLVNAKQVEILTGSATLANDAIAAQLSLLSAPGLILSNGEFGDRLIDHGRRFRLPFAVHRIEWGEAFRPSDIAPAIARDTHASWLWAVHCETSTGMLNDLAMLKRVCAAKALRLAMDCVSSIGAVPVNLDGVFLASAASGKALGAFPGLAMVFHETECIPAPNDLPRSLDLGHYARHDGIPFTLPSNLLDALSAALDRQTNNDFGKIAKLAAWLRAELKGIGCKIVGDGRTLSPAVTTIALPAAVSSRTLGKQLAAAGFLLSYMSGYLLQRNWLQICLMGEILEADLRALVEELRRAIEEPMAHEPSAALQATWPTSILPAQREAP